MILLSETWLPAAIEIPTPSWFRRSSFRSISTDPLTSNRMMPVAVTHEAKGMQGSAGGK